MLNKINLLSYPISEKTPTYGNRNKLKIQPLTSIKNGDTANSSKWIFETNHIGTHIDFPRHFSINGNTIDDYKPSDWVFEKIGIIDTDITNFENELLKVNDDIEFLIWKSGFGINRERRQYWESQPVIPSSFADIICKKFKNLKIFGFDMISLTSKLDREEGKRIHEKFLCEYKILIIEDMNLLSLKDKNIKKIVVSPWYVKGTDGSPCSILSFS